jgi:hypothetical protein
MTKEEAPHPKIRNKVVNEIFDDIRLTFTKHLTEQQDVSFEEMDIIINRLQDGILQSKVELMFKWLLDEMPANRPKPQDIKFGNNPYH